MTQRKRILFIAESATLAHVARPYALARELDPAAFDVVFACADTYLSLFPEWPWRREAIRSIEPRVFMDRLAKGHRLYPLETLREYARDDLRLIESLRPDAIVGDFRLSLSATARAAQVPYVALTNAYWSPYAERRRIPVPCLPMTRWVGLPLASALFTLSRPVAFAWHTRPLNRLRAEYGLPSLGLDLPRVYTDADITLYSDVPQLVPTVGRPAHHQYIGPVQWSPSNSPPEFLQREHSDRALVYVTMGSSGSAVLLPTIVEALAGLDCRVAIATAGVRLSHLPANATAADYLPGDQLARQARLVICNGGSPTSHQALAEGTPVMGIPSNLDQHLNMEYVSTYGAGLTLRPENATVAAVRAAAGKLLQDVACRQRAQDLAAIFRSYRPGEALARSLHQAMQTPS